MAHFTVNETKAWLEPTKAGTVFNSVDTNLEAQVAEQVFSRLRETFDVSTWVNEVSTPALVRSILCMLYVAWVYERQYTSDGANDDVSAYAAMLRRYAEINITGLLDGTIELAEQPNDNADASVPVFYPTDLSSDPRIGFATDDPSAGPPAFRMGTIW